MTKQTVGSVYTANHIQWLDEELDSGIDLDWEEHIAECTNDDHDDCGPSESSTILIGDWHKGRDGKYEPCSGSKHYSAIYNGGSFGSYTVQVVRSKWWGLRAACSPCYPHQADAETAGSIRCYLLPKDLVGSDE